MGLNDDFIKDPKAFMKKNVVFMGNTKVPDYRNLPTKSGDYDFDLVKGEVAYELRHVAPGKKPTNGPPIRAFYLHYMKQLQENVTPKTKEDAVFTAKLVSKANLFFTAELSGCAFGAQRSQEQPNVVHIDGQHWTDDEILKKFENKYGALYVRAQYDTEKDALGLATILGTKNGKIWQFFAQPIELFSGMNKAQLRDKNGIVEI